MGTCKRSLEEEIKLITEIKSELALPKLYITWELSASARYDSVFAFVCVFVCVRVCVCVCVCTEGDKPTCKMSTFLVKKLLYIT